MSLPLKSLKSLPRIDQMLKTEVFDVNIVMKTVEPRVEKTEIRQ